MSSRLDFFLSFFKRNRNNLPAYWQKRVKLHGKRAVLNLNHSEDEYEFVTEEQKRMLFPILNSLLNGSEQTILDFGCGPGRFTSDLANKINGTAVGIDLSEDFLKLAPRAPNVKYMLLSDDVVWNERFKFDVIWVCLVLGAIPKLEIEEVAKLISKSLNPNGLLFLVENTSDKKDGTYWFFRSQSEYKALFPDITLQYLATYVDAGETISVMAGRKQ